VDGERRYLAAGIAGLTHVPCIVQPPKGYLDTRIQQMQRNNALPMSPLEWAQASYNAYLAANITALAQEQSVPDPTTGLIESGITPTEQREKLEGWLMELAGDTVVSYLTSGAVRVTRKDVFTRLGKPTSDTAIKKLWAVLKLPTALQDALSGSNVTGRTLRDLAALDDPEQQAALVDAAAASDDPNATLRTALTANAEPDVTDDPDARDAWPEPEPAPAPLDPDADLLAVDLADERPDGFVPDPALALPFGGGSGGKAAMRVDGPAPSGGSVPPDGFGASWSADLVLRYHAGMEALLDVLDSAGAARLLPDQQRRLGVMWRELAERSAQVGIADEAAL
jgi:ParB-like chromosome segregation protein Spo0J